MRDLVPRGRVPRRDGVAGGRVPRRRAIVFSTASAGRPPTASTLASTTRAGTRSCPTLAFTWPGARGRAASRRPDVAAQSGDAPGFDRGGDRLERLGVACGWLPDLLVDDPAEQRFVPRQLILGRAGAGWTRREASCPARPRSSTPARGRARRRAGGSPAWAVPRGCNSGEARSHGSGALASSNALGEISACDLPWLRAASSSKCERIALEGERRPCWRRHRDRAAARRGASLRGGGQHLLGRSRGCLRWWPRSPGTEMDVLGAPPPLPSRAAPARLDTRSRSVGARTHHREAGAYQKVGRF